MMFYFLLIFHYEGVFMRYRKKKDLLSYSIWIFTTLANNAISLTFESRDGFEYLTGTIVSTIILILLDFLTFKIAWGLTHEWIRMTDADHNESSHFHWICRCIMTVILLIFSRTSLCFTLLTSVVHIVHDLVCIVSGNILDKMTIIIRNALNNLNTQSS